MRTKIRFSASGARAWRSDRACAYPGHMDAQPDFDHMPHALVTRMAESGEARAQQYMEGFAADLAPIFADFARFATHGPSVLGQLLQPAVDSSATDALAEMHERKEARERASIIRERRTLSEMESMRARAERAEGGRRFANRMAVVSMAVAVAAVVVPLLAG